MQLKKTVERFLKVHLVSSDFIHFSINVVFFPAQINVICKKKKKFASFEFLRFAICKILYATFISFLCGQIIFFKINYVFRESEKGTLGSIVLNTNFMFL